MPEMIKPKQKPLFQQKVPFYKAKWFKVIILVSFIIIVSVAIFLIFGMDYSAQTLEKTI
ncbi:hypothetical protein J4467_01550 [Candidatus Woesearchaeota archaeon]|nr:hypothetical protein [Candidatus Woesearchaeota archaeon]